MTANDFILAKSRHNKNGLTKGVITLGPYLRRVQSMSITVSGTPEPSRIMGVEQTSNPEKVQHIWCSVEISKKMEDVLTGWILKQAQNNENITEYVLYLSTTGGNPFASISLYNFIKAIPQKTTVYNMGTVASAGVPFFLGFQNRIGVPDSSFMVHQTSMSKSFLPDNVTVFEMQTQQANLEATDDKAQKIIVKETANRGKKSLTPAAIKDKTTFYDANEAQTLGFIEKIELPKIPNTGVLYLTDQYLATLPG